MIRVMSLWQPHWMNQVATFAFIPHTKPTRHHPSTRAHLDPQLGLLRQWQMTRLARTYSDLLASLDSGDACRFFLSEVYGPRDFNQRDQDITQVYRSMERFLPVRIVHTIELAIRLNDLTLDLDDTLLRVLVKELNVTDTITPELYAEAYRRCHNYDERAEQIDLVIIVGQKINQLVHIPFIGLTLRMAHQPAHWMGWSELQEFLERGYAAFKHLSDSKMFLQIIEQREKQILDQLFAGVSKPFAI